MNSLDEMLAELAEYKHLHHNAVSTVSDQLARISQLVMERDLWKSKAEYYAGLIDQLPAETPARVAKAKTK